MSREFDRYMLHVDAGTEEKFATLSDSEYRAHIVGVLAVAAKSPMRGYLFVGELQAEPVHIARRAGVTERVAASAIRKLKAVGVLVFDDEVGAWRVHSWENHQPERRDPTAAKRAAEYRARRAAERDASRDDAPPVTAESRSPSREARDVPKDVKKGEEGSPPQPPASGGRARTRQKWEGEVLSWARSVGVDGPDATVLRALGQCAPWKHNGDSADVLRVFVAQHFASSLTVQDGAS